MPLRRWLPGLACVVLALLVHATSIRNPFVYDDIVNVVEKQTIRDLANPWPLLFADRFRPLVNLTYALDFALFELDPRGYHLTNILLHGLNVALLYGLALMVLGDLRRRGAPPGSLPQPTTEMDRFGAMAVAGFFAVHPLLTQAVSYISGRAEVLCATLFFVAFLCLRRTLWGGRWPWLVLGLLAMGLGFGAKEHGAMLPFVLLTYDRLVVRDLSPDPRRRLLRLHLPLVALVAFAGLLRTLALFYLEYEQLPRPVLQNLLMQASALWRYIFLFFMSINQSIVHQIRPVNTILDPVTLIAGAAILSLLVISVLLRRQFPLVSLGVLWFFLLMAPSSSVIPLLEPMAEQRVYLASVGPFLLLGGSLPRLAPPLGAMARWLRPLPIILFVAVIAVLGVGTVKRNRVWADPIRLWTEASLNAPGVWAAHYALGNALRDAGDCKAATAAYRQAIKLLPDEPRAFLNLGICLARVQDFEESRRVFQSLLSMDPRSTQARNNLGMLALAQARFIEAEAHFHEVLSLDPGNLEALSGLGLVAEKLGNWDQAERIFRRLLTISPTYLFGLLHLAHILETRQGDLGEAMRLCQTARQAAPDHPGPEACLRRLQERLESGR